MGFLLFVELGLVGLVGLVGFVLVVVHQWWVVWSGRWGCSRLYLDFDEFGGRSSCVRGARGSES
jgi:hypothetical protein